MIDGNYEIIKNIYNFFKYKFLNNKMYQINIQ